MWLNQVIAELGEEVQPNWRYFSLNQQNYDGEDDWQIWNEPKQNANWENEKIAPPLYYFLAAEAARKQGSAAFDRFHLALLTARHEEPKQTVYTRAEVIAIAEEAGLDIDRFQTDFHDLTGLDKLAEDHQYSRTLNVFGTPTLVFPGAEPVYVKLDRLLTPEEALDFWQVLKQTAIDRPYVLEIKRPQ